MLDCLLGQAELLWPTGQVRDLDRLLSRRKDCSSANRRASGVAVGFLFAIQHGMPRASAGVPLRILG
jgi:hypothetical protein